MPLTSALLLIDKPQGLTSHDVVARCRRAMHTRKVGHAGTLDPMATGLLLVGINRATKTLTYLVGLDKTYTATIRLGQSTTTDDAEGEIVSTASADAVSQLRDADIASTIRSTFVGAIKQRPSSVSAIKINGERAYKRVRRGEQVDIPERDVTIAAFDILAIHRELDAAIDIDVSVSCSSGTYIRALARDLGEALHVGGHLTKLRRTRVGPFRVEDAVAVTPLQERSDGTTTSADALTRLPAQSTLSLADTMGAVMSTRELSASEVRLVRFGQRIGAEGQQGTYAGIDESGGLVAILEDRGAEAVSRLVIPADAMVEDTQP